MIAANKSSRTVACFGLSAHFVKVFKMLGLAKYTTIYDNESAASAAGA